MGCRSVKENQVHEFSGALDGEVKGLRDALAKPIHGKWRAVLNLPVTQIPYVPSRDLPLVLLPASPVGLGKAAISSERALASEPRERSGASTRVASERVGARGGKAGYQQRTSARE